MKIILVAIGLLLALSPVFAQLTPGKPFVGTHFGGSIKRENASTKTTAINFSPMAAFAVSSHWMLGMQASTSFSKSESDARLSAPVPTSSGYYYQTSINAIKTKFSTIGFGPMARYYTTLGPTLAFLLKEQQATLKQSIKFIAKRLSSWIQALAFPLVLPGEHHLLFLPTGARVQMRTARAA
ncbi:hypothetical protein [Pontibacter brevis]